MVEKLFLGEGLGYARLLTCVCVFVRDLFLYVFLCLLRFLRSALRRGRRALYLLTGENDACAIFMDAHGKPCAMTRGGRVVFTDAKHRVRSTRGARGSNPSQKTPRQRSAR